MSYIKYSVFRYSPSMVAGESINLGILFEALNYRSFIFTKRFARIKEFDDEIDVDIIKLFLRSIQKDVEMSISNSITTFDMDKFIKYYTNQYSFDKPIVLETDDLEKTIEEIQKIYLRYDFSRSERLTREQEISFISKVLSDKHVPYKRNMHIKGKYSENIIYDYKFLSYGVKIFLLNGKSLNRIFNDIKAWAWNCQNNSEIINTIILYDYDENSNKVNQEYFYSILNILKDASSHVYRLDEGIKIINNLTKQYSMVDK